MIVVLYHGLCLVSSGDSLLIRGKWVQGKKLGIQGNVVVADKVENRILESFSAKNEQKRNNICFA
jgi:hypothetical protein